MKNNIVIILSIILAILLTACHMSPQDISSSVDTEVITITESVMESLITDEISSVEKTTSSQQSNSSASTISQNSQADNTTVESLSEENKTTVSENNSVGNFVQLADPKTGISWDGISPIIYTYEDGTTGTEKRDGATYEYAPGMITTYNIPRDLAGREIGTICTICQKEIQSLSIGIYCTQTKYKSYCGECGVYLQPYTCHTCSNYNDTPRFCSDCGKLYGDGTKGTCITWLISDMECPNCSEYVKVHTCHTCK